MTGKSTVEAGQPKSAPGALPPKAPEGRKRSGLGFDSGPNKRARGGYGPDGDQQAAAGRAGTSGEHAVHSNGGAAAGDSREHPDSSRTVPEVSLPGGGHDNAPHRPSGPAPGSPVSRDGERTERPVYTDQCTAFVKNIAPSTTDDQLRQAFACCGQLQALRHLRQANGDSRVSLPCTRYTCVGNANLQLRGFPSAPAVPCRWLSITSKVYQSWLLISRCMLQGFAYLEFADDASLQAALQLSGTQLNEYALNVAKSQPPGSRGGGGGRGGGRDGGRDGTSSRGGGSAGRARGGRAGGRGGGSDGGRGSTPGDGRPRPHVPANAPHVEAATGAPRQRLLPGGGAPAMAFVPRSVSAAKTSEKGPPAKSNADFRSMFLKKDSAAQ